MYKLDVVYAVSSLVRVQITDKKTDRAKKQRKSPVEQTLMLMNLHTKHIEFVLRYMLLVY